jgi:hypothetical protein
MVFKIITSKDINYNDGVIDKIDGICFKKKEIILLRDIYNINPNIASINIEDKNLMSSNWKRYIENLKKLE